MPINDKASSIENKKIINKEYHRVKLFLNLANSSRAVTNG